MKNAYIIAAATPFLLACTASSANTTIKMGDGFVDGAELAPYSLTWRQCSLQEGEWQDGGPLTEEAVIIGANILRITQNSSGPGGRTATSTTYFDRQTLSPLRKEQVISAPDGSIAIRRVHQLDASGYQVTTERGGETATSSGSANTQMYDGAALGLPLATLNYENAPFFLESSMVAFDATYKMVVTPVGEEQMMFGEETVNIIKVDIEWRHNELGDVYPPGPDASGGQYWIAQNPPMGFPYVPRYKTDSYAIEFIPGVCPMSKENEE